VAALYLEKLFEGETTEHRIVVTPDTRSSFLKEAKSFFKNLGPVEFVINRSTAHFELPDGNDPFLVQMKSAQKRELALTKEIHIAFKDAPIEKIPLMVMGEDTKEELLEFVEAIVYSRHS